MLQLLIVGIQRLYGGKIMVIIDALWEKRNLGTTAVEVQFECQDDIDMINEDFQSIKARYIVAKVPSVRHDINLFIQEQGYKYIEDMIRVEHDLHEPCRNTLHQRLYDVTTYRRMTPEDIMRMKDEIRAGLFSLDRISIDKEFGPKLSIMRYINWVDDLIQDKAEPYVILYKDDPAGFVILQTKDGRTYNSVLGGGYEKYRNSGLGIVQKEYEIVRALGGKKLETQVSSNNSGQLRALEMNGCVTRSINHIYVKHNQ